MITAKPILCLDFDGVIHSYTSGWKGAHVIPDPPVPGAMAFIRAALEHFTVAIYSSRSGQAGGISAMREWLMTHMEDHLASDHPGAFVAGMHAAREIVDNSIMWPTEKPAAMVTLDDRAITFTGEWPAIETLLAFKPWNKK